MTFALFFLGEYANMILMSATTTVLFLGGWLPPFNIAPFTWIPGPIWFILKIAACLFVFLWVRATLPRYRYDQLMRLGWKVRKDGIIFATGPGGVWVFSPEGRHLGTIKTGQATSNCAFDEDNKFLYMTADTYLMRIRLK